MTRAAMCVAAGLLFVVANLHAGDPPANTPAAKEAAPTTQWVPAVKPKPISENVQKALAWLAGSQLKGGGWGQGEESAHMGGGADLKDKDNVGETCMAVLAFIRAGNTPTAGEYKKNVVDGVKFVCSQVEDSDKDSILVTKLTGTRLQAKLGANVDTFMAALMLAEVHDIMGDKALRERVGTALDKVTSKMVKNQQKDGGWGGGGWAGTLSNGIAGKAVARAEQSGALKDSRVRDNLSKSATGKFAAAADGKSGSFKGDRGAAGVELYAQSSNISQLQDNANTNAMRVKDLQKTAATGPTPEARKKAQSELESIAKDDKLLDQAKAGLVKNLEDEKFKSGFGSNGGEEYLSYMNIGETLVVKGGPEWEKWDKEITGNLNRIQNNDGTWSGHHCITGRTFCTSAALLVLLTDRAPVPLAAKVKKQ